MFDWLKKFISFLLNGINIKNIYKSSSSSVNGNVDNSIVSGRDINNYFGGDTVNLNVGVPFEMIFNVHESNLGEIANDFLKDFKSAYNINDSLLQRIMSDYGNYKAFCVVINQVASTKTNSKDRRMLLSQLLMDKFKDDNGEVDIYLQAIKVMENLSVRDIKLLSVMTFIMILSRYLRVETIKVNSNHIISLINEVAKVSEDEFGHLNSLSIIYMLFPNQFDDSCITRLQECAPDLYNHCFLWLDRNSAVCNYKISSLGRVLAKALFAVNYDLNYEDFVDNEFPLKECDLNVKNIHASGNIVSQGGVAAGGTISMGSLT